MSCRQYPRVERKPLLCQQYCIVLEAACTVGVLRLEKIKENYPLKWFNFYTLFSSVVASIPLVFHYYCAIIGSEMLKT